MHVFATLITVLVTFSIIVASPLGEKHVQLESRALSKPPVPSVSELKSHLLSPDRDEWMFFTGRTLQAAQTYADANNKVLLGDLSRNG